MFLGVGDRRRRLAGPAQQEACAGESSAQILATCENDSSTGVSRPKIETSTLSFCCSGLISEIVAGRVSKGPSVTVTDSPTENSTSIGALGAPPPDSDLEVCFGARAGA